jgi:hypothetical protein
VSVSVVAKYRSLAISFVVGILLAAFWRFGFRTSGNPGWGASPNSAASTHSTDFRSPSSGRARGVMTEVAGSMRSPRSPTPPTFLPASGERIPVSGNAEIPIMYASELYEKNFELIPTFNAEARKHVGKPELVKAWKACGEAYARRQGVEADPRRLDITLAYTIRVQKEVGQVLAHENLEGGDDELMRCLWNAEEWLRHPFPAPGASDGTFRWRIPNYNVWYPK